VLVLAFPAAASATRFVRLGPAANGTTAHLHVGDVLVISLPGEPGNNYRWVLFPLDARTLGAGTMNFEAATANPDGPGTYSLGLRAYAAGKTSLKLGYVLIGRPRREAVRIFDLTVRVSKA
jgi:predicted secreted protein